MNYQQFSNEKSSGYHPSSGLGGISQLSSISGIYVRQKFEALEALCGFETENKYSISAADSNGNPLELHLFQAHETSSCLARQCLGGGRPFEITISNESDGSPVLNLIRECTCTICCLNRPKLVVQDAATKKTLGTAVHPFNCFSCDLLIDILDADNQPAYTIRGKCCQVGVCCALPCGSCSLIDFEILDKSGAPISKAQKRAKSLLKSCFGDANHLSLNFPQNTNVEQRALLLGSLFLLDFMYFERN